MKLTSHRLSSVQSGTPTVVARRSCPMCQKLWQWWKCCWKVIQSTETLAGFCADSITRSRGRAVTSSGLRAAATRSVLQSCWRSKSRSCGQLKRISPASTMSSTAHLGTRTATTLSGHDSGEERSCWNTERTSASLSILPLPLRQSQKPQRGENSAAQIEERNCVGCAETST